MDDKQVDPGGHCRTSQWASLPEIKREGWPGLTNVTARLRQRGQPFLPSTAPAPGGLPRDEGPSGPGRPSISFSEVTATKGKPSPLSAFSSLLELVWP